MIQVLGRPLLVAVSVLLIATAEGMKEVNDTWPELCPGNHGTNCTSYCESLSGDGDGGGGGVYVAPYRTTGMPPTNGETLMGEAYGICLCDKEDFRSSIGDGTVSIESSNACKIKLFEFSLPEAPPGGVVDCAKYKAPPIVNSTTCHETCTRLFWGNEYVSSGSRSIPETNEKIDCFCKWTEEHQFDLCTGMSSGAFGTTKFMVFSSFLTVLLTSTVA